MKEFEEYYCDRCMCQHKICSLVENARIWIKMHPDVIETRFFEDVVNEYPGAPRPFMLAWCEEFGGI